MESAPESGDVLASQTPQKSLPATAAAGVHVLVWGGLILALAFPAARFMAIFEDFGIELPVGQRLVLVLTNAAANTWYLTIPAVLAFGCIDWLILTSLDTPNRRALARLWFWTLVVVPLLLALLAAIQIALNYIELLQELS